MCKLPPGRIEVRKGKQRFILFLTPDIHSLLRLYAQDADTSITDAGNRIILGFLSEHYEYENIPDLRRRILKAIFPTRKVIYETLVSILKRRKPRLKPLPLRRNDKLPSFLTESGSSGQDSP